MKSANLKKFNNSRKQLFILFLYLGISIYYFIFCYSEYIKSNKVKLELNELTKKKNELNNLKSQYK